MNATTVAIDLAKSVFQLAVQTDPQKPPKLLRLTRPQFERWFDNRPVALVIMEACSSAHYWARFFQTRAIPVRLLPPHQVKPYVKRNKTDAADALALLEANRCFNIYPVPVKSVEQQALQLLNRARDQWIGSQTRVINNLRGACHEFGVVVRDGVRRGLDHVAQVLADESSPIPPILRATMRAELDEARQLAQRLLDLERELSRIAAASRSCELLESIPGVGLITSTAMAAKTGGDVSMYRGNRRFASSFGLTPKEDSSGLQRRLGCISKRGDHYLRKLLTHGARSLLLAATIQQRKGLPLDPLRTWALAVQARTHRNKAVCALANKLARICYAVLRDQVPYQGLRSRPRRKNELPAAT
jgi:transposase